jgi:hypothetical protein
MMIELITISAPIQNFRKDYYFAITISLVPLKFVHGILVRLRKRHRKN